MMENNQVNHLNCKERINEQLKKYNQSKNFRRSGIIASIVLIVISYCVTLYCAIPDDYHTQSFGLMILFRFYSPIIGFTILFVSSIYLKPKNYWILRNVIVFSFLQGKQKSGRRLKSLLQAFLSFSIYFIGFLIAPPIFVTYSGTHLVEISPIGFSFYFFIALLVFFIAYIVFLLPQLIKLKTGTLEYQNRKIADLEKIVKADSDQHIITDAAKQTEADCDKYPWIFWYHFLKSRIYSSPFLMYLIPGLILFVLIVTIALPFIEMDHYPNIFMAWKRIESFSLLFAIVGLFISVGIILCNDLLKNYERIYQCYEEYTTLQLRDRIFAGKEIKTIIIGFGNLSRIVLGNRIEQLIKPITKSNPEIFDNFEVIIDRDFKIRVIPKDIIVIEIESSMFEELRIDSNSGLAYGFLNGSDIIQNKTLTNEIPAELALFALNGDGGNLPLLNNANITKSPLIINTTSDPDMGFRLKRAIESGFKSDSKPTIITTVEDSSANVFLEETSNSSFFPLHAAQIEGTNIGLRLYSYYRKNLAENINIVIVGRGKALYYAIETLRLYLKNDLFYDDTLLQIKLEEEITIISNDQHIKNESNPIGEFEFSHSLRKKWNVAFNKDGMLSINLVSGNPDRFNVIADGWKWIADDPKWIEDGKVESLKKSHTVFVVSSVSINDTLRILENICQLVSFRDIRNASVLTSMATEISGEVETILKKMPFLKKHSLLTDRFHSLKPDSFPSTFDDFTVEKNWVIGSRIHSISNSVENKKSTNSLLIRDLTPSPVFNSVSSELVFCLPNKPGAYVQLLSDLSKFAGLSPFKKNKLLPSIIYSYCYSLISENKSVSGSFIIRADISLLEQENYFALFGHHPSKNNINSYNIFGSNSAREKIKELIDPFVTHKLENICDHFSLKCPISFHNMTAPKTALGKEKTETTIQNDGKLALVKIWADGDRLSGTLAMALADFLMIGQALEFTGLPKTEVLNIAYDNFKLCYFNHNMMSRAYVYSELINDDMVTNIKTMLAVRNIRAIKIKYIGETRGAWWNYLEDVMKYLNDISPNNYEIIEANLSLILYRTDIWADPDSNYFIKRTM